MTRSVTPLPATLSGNIIQRLIEIDEALIPYVNGALVWLCDKEPFEETGTLTVDEAKLLFSDMLQIYFTETVSMPVIGSYLMCAAEIAPDGYLVCDGSAVSRTTYVDLFNLIMTNYGAGDGSTTFNIPYFGDLSPMGVGGTIVGQPGAVQGAAEVTLNTTQIPAHNHTINDAGHTHLLPRASGTAGGTVQRPATPVNTALAPNTAITDVGVTGITINNTGGGLPHSNVHPVMGVQMLIYAGA